LETEEECVMIVKRGVCAVVVLLIAVFAAGFACADPPSSDGEQPTAGAAPMDPAPKDVSQKGAEPQGTQPKGTEKAADGKKAKATGSSHAEKPGDKGANEKADGASKPSKKGDSASKSDGGSSVPPRPQADDDRDIIAVEANLISYTNAQRAKHGLAPLKPDKALMRSARRHCAWMARNRSMVHTSQPVAENIAMGQPSSLGAVGAWMNSSGHRANILSRGHGRIGVAAYRSPSGTIFWCQQFRR
jgi:uncharacterized protein YkwD